jgi:hypothetical protein
MGFGSNLHLVSRQGLGLWSVATIYCPGNGGSGVMVECEMSLTGSCTPAGGTIFRGSANFSSWDLVGESRSLMVCPWK